MVVRYHKGRLQGYPAQLFPIVPVFVLLRRAAISTTAGRRGGEQGVMRSTAASDACATHPMSRIQPVARQ
jgi:hypothetical protein